MEYHKQLSVYAISFFGMHEWCKSLSHCLFDYRTTPHSSTGHRPTDLFFRFNVKGYLPSKAVDVNDAVNNDFHAKQKRKLALNKKNKNRTFECNTKVLVKNINAPKCSLKGDECIIVKQIDDHSVIVRTKPGREFRCSTSRVSKIALSETEEDEDDWYTLPNSKSDTVADADAAQSQAETVVDEPRKSKRVSFAPTRYGEWVNN